jgi:hypothetical protein
VPLVSKPISFACRGERLAGTRTCPDRPVVGPSGEAQGEAPPADAGEEMALRELGEFVGSNVTDVSPVHHAGGDLPGAYQFFEPQRGALVDLVVEGRHAATSARSLRTSGSMALSAATSAA